MTAILKVIGEAIAVIFAPLGLGNWQAAVATVSAELAKEQATGPSVYSHMRHPTARRMSLRLSSTC